MQEVKHGLSHGNMVCLLQTHLDMVTNTMSSDIDYRIAVMKNVKTFVERKKLHMGCPTVTWCVYSRHI